MGSTPRTGRLRAYLRRKFGDYMRLPDLDTIHRHSAKITFED